MTCGAGAARQERSDPERGKETTATAKERAAYGGLGASFKRDDRHSAESEMIGTPAPSLELRGIDKRFGGVNGAGPCRAPRGSGDRARIAGRERSGEDNAHANRLWDAAARMPERWPSEESSAGSDRRRMRLLRELAWCTEHYALVQAMTVSDNVALGLSGHYSAREAVDRVRALSEEIRACPRPRGCRRWVVGRGRSNGSRS